MKYRRYKGNDHSPVDQANAESSEREGVIKYHLEFKQQKIACELPIAQLDQWRHVLFNLELIGQSPERYGGLGYGNISCRIKPNAPAFLITGSQTGGHPFLQKQHFAVVTCCDASLNHLQAYGECIPSSEAMTHGTLYEQSASVGAVVHVHSPLIWQLSDQLGLLATPLDVPYGTPAMAAAVTKVYQEISQHALPPVFVMKGHADGVVSFGANVGAAVMALLDIYNRAVLK